MRLTTLGTAAAAVPKAHDAGTGHLVTHGDARLLVDVGPGVLGELTAHARLEDVTAVYLTHLHQDHVGDLYPLALWARFTNHRVRLLGPPGTRTLLYRWFSLFSSDPDPYVESLAITEYESWRAYDVGGIQLLPCPVEHNLACFALRAEADGKRFVFSGDTRAGAPLIEAAEGADLLLCEATYQDLEPGRAPEASRAHHMTAREAGETAKRAGAKRLVLTHLRYHMDPQLSLAQAREAFGGSVELATPGATFDL